MPHVITRARCVLSREIRVALKPDAVLRFETKPWRSNLER
jgi:hypothetical protein